jgi:hypothetical protein
MPSGTAWCYAIFPMNWKSARLVSGPWRPPGCGGQGEVVVPWLQPSCTLPGSELVEISYLEMESSKTVSGFFSGLVCKLTVILVVVRVLCRGPFPGRLGWTLVMDVARFLEGEDRRSLPEGSGVKNFESPNFFLSSNSKSEFERTAFLFVIVYLGLLTRASASSGSMCSARKKFLLTLFMS